MKYKYIISLGHFCSVASELERKGYRNYSLPFDWVITTLGSVNALIENNFSDLLKCTYLYRDPKYNYIVKHKGYGFDFYHDFKVNNEIQCQIENFKHTLLKRTFQNEK
ncbi:MAG TPA: DUF1796 family putative cysteine peptidase, partial [Clostridiales bacterium]|nr:DUF1796 family putative cysteine peptidase [Clostridiales bacterium]